MIGRIARILAMLMLAVMGAVACANNVSDTPLGDEQVRAYNGGWLLCRVWRYVNGNHGYDCNFDLFYAMPGATYPGLAHINLQALPERTTVYRGVPLHYLAFDIGNSQTGQTSDYPRWRRDGGGKSVVVTK